MQWSITGTVFEADGKPATSQVELQIYDMARQVWRSVVKGSLNSKGDFALKLGRWHGCLRMALITSMTTVLIC